MECKNGKLLHTLSGHEARITSIAISSDNSFIVTGSCDKTAKIWEGGILKKKLLPMNTIQRLSFDTLDAPNTVSTPINSAHQLFSKCKWLLVIKG